MGRDNVLKRTWKLAGFTGRVVADTPTKPSLTVGTVAGGRVQLTIQLNTIDGVTIRHAEPVRVRLWDSIGYNVAHTTATLDVVGTTDGTTWGTSDSNDTNHHTSKTGGLTINVDNTAADIVYITVEPRAGSHYMMFSANGSADFS